MDDELVLEHDDDCEDEIDVTDDEHDLDEQLDKEWQHELEGDDEELLLEEL